MEETDKKKLLNERVHKTFSQLFFDAIKINKLNLNSPITNESKLKGHGPFANHNGQTLYDLTHQGVLGHTHPLELNSLAHQICNVALKHDQNLEEFKASLLEFFDNFSFCYVLSPDSISELSKFKVINYDFDKKIDLKAIRKETQNDILLNEGIYFSRLSTKTLSSYHNLENNIDAVLITQPFSNNIILSNKELDLSESQELFYDPQIFRLIMRSNFFGEHGRINQIETFFLSKLKENKNIEIKNTGLVFQILSNKLRAKDLKEKLYELGVLVKLLDNHHIQLQLPLCITDKHLNEIALLIEKATQ